MRPWLSAVLPLALFVAAPAEPPQHARLSGSIISFGRTAMDPERTRDLGLAVELRLGEHTSLTAGIRGWTTRGKIIRWEEEYLEGTELRSLGGHAAYRVYPWEWLPGFFAQGLAGFGMEEPRKPEPGRPRPASLAKRSTTPLLQEGYRRSLRTAEASLGFGYLFTWRAMTLTTRFALGPEMRWRTDTFDSGRQVTESYLGSLLRFHDLELGYSF